MEVAVLGSTGIAPESYVSFGDSSQRVMRRADAGKPYRLAQSPEEPGVLKVEVFNVAGTTRLVRQPGVGSYNVSIAGPSGAEAMQLQIGISRPGEGAEPPEKIRGEGGSAGAVRKLTQNNEYQKYLDEHRLTEYLQAMVKAILETKPADPYMWMAEQLMSRRAADGADAPPPPPPPVPSQSRDLPTGPADEAKAAPPPSGPIAEERRPPPCRGGACIVTGPSGVGKSTLINKLMAEFPGRFGFAVSHTTREPRPGEQDGVHYHFVSREDMERFIQAGLFIEHAEVHGNYYGTSLDAVESVTKEGKVCLLDIDVQGAASVRKTSLAARTSFVFFAPPTVEVLEQRLRGRGTETEERIQKRLAGSIAELGTYEADPDAWNLTLKWFNENVDDAYAEFRAFLLKQLPDVVPPIAVERRSPPSEGGACVVTGPSGVGKSTLINKLMAEFPKQFGFSVSHTTREPRPGEEDGVHYHFVTREAMERDINAGLFIEHAEVHGNYYGTSIAAVETVMTQGKVCLLDIDVQGAESVRKSVLAGKTSFVFFAPPTLEVLEQRLRGRGTETEDKVQKRLAGSKGELAVHDANPDAWHLTLRWFNENVDDAYVEFRTFLTKQLPSDSASAAAPSDPVPTAPIASAPPAAASCVPPAVCAGHMMLNSSAMGPGFYGLGLAPRFMLI
eukprot:CAMPEP_0176024218 /NCGR_PEP_ID=MMETSP0120_2-20121206/11831_1 /TAXON_ID=160619 /ORGANISM="Kryptoperidinium foliaceum, Strain CCMP 1326" /LENGTH=672 /DNA_ID=CAMNT_0017357395 /DNA_START=9 /DNA_END=2027 /DNA_ORIENTATION=-